MASVKQWEPSYDKEAIRDAIQKYTYNPEMFDDDQIDDLQNHAQHYRMPFARNEQDQEAFLTKVIKNIGIGFGEGFTTLPGETIGASEPMDTTEGIARNLGHLAGFVGYVPGAKVLPFLRILRGKSLPMAAAGKAQRALKKTFEPALLEAGGFAKEFAQGNLASDLASGAFHLGVASAVSSWTDGVDAMIESAGFGATFGAVFRGIGNMPGFGKKLAVQNYDRATGAVNLKSLSGGQRLDLGLRTVAGSMFQGLPSSMQGQTTEEQVYNYLMGGFFGFKESPMSTRTSREFIHKTLRNKEIDHPLEHPDFQKLTPQMQEIVRSDLNWFYGEGEAQAIGYKLFRDSAQCKKLTPDRLLELAKEQGFEYGRDPVTDKPFVKLTEEQKKKNLRDIEQEVENVGSDIDAGDMTPVEKRYDEVISKGQAMKAFIDSELGPQLRKKYPNILDREKATLDLAADMYAHWKTLQEPLKENPNITRPKPRAGEQMVEWLFKKGEYVAGENGASWWRQYSEKRRLAEPIRIMTMNIEGKDYADTNLAFLDKHNAVNKAGNRKDIQAQPPLIQKVYEEILRYHPLVKNRNVGDFFTYLDHFVVNGKEMPLTELQEWARRTVESRIQKREEYEHLRDTQETGIKEIKQELIDAEINKHRSGIMNFAAKQGMYYVGGRGDNKRMYFMRNHPLLESLTKKERGTAAKDMIKAFTEQPKYFKDGKKYARDSEGRLIRNPLHMSIKEINEFMQYGIKKYGEFFKDKVQAKNEYIKSMLNNIMYDLDFNGYRVFPKDKRKPSIDFKQVIKEGYLSDAKAYNKRAQIWFNSGLSADTRWITRVKNPKTNTELRKDGKVVREASFNPFAI